MIIGYLYALITSVFFSLYLIPRKFSKNSPATYTAFMGLGFFIPSLFYAMTLPDFSALLNPLLLLAFLVGIIWMVASVFFVTAIDKLGLSRSNQWKNFQGPIGAGLSLLVLAEYQTTNLPCVLIAICAIFVSALLFSIKKKTEKVIDRRGIWYALAASVLFGANSVIQKYVTINVLEIPSQLLYFSAGVFLSALIYLWLKNKNLNSLQYTFAKDGLRPMLAGLIYFVAAYFSVMANKIIPNSIAFTIIQFNAVWTILIGVLIFREIDFRAHWRRILTGLLFAIISIGVLFLGAL